MRYLFFDTESANCFDNVYKMCEWGSLLTDEAFHVLQGTKKDFVIHPGKGGVFFLRGRKGGRDLVLAHSEKEYYRAKPFYTFYDDIKFFLNMKDTMIFLWAGENDIQALLDQCHRYHMPKFSFVSYDVQMLFRLAMPEVKTTPSLEKAMDLLGLSKEGIVPHRPDDDALMTALILKALCEKTGKSVLELIGECPKCRMESIPTYEEMKRRHAANVEQKRLAERRKKVLAPFIAELNAVFDRGIPAGFPKERTFKASKETKAHLDETLAHIKTWLERGFLIKKKNGASYLVYYDEAERERLQAHMDLGNTKLISIGEFDALTKR